MSDRTGQYLLINKHLLYKKGKKKSRHFFTAEEIEDQKVLAKKYAENNGMII